MFTRIIKVVGILALLTALFLRPSNAPYAIPFEIIVSIGALIIAGQAMQIERPFWAAAFVAIALAFNPVMLVFRTTGFFSILLIAIAIATFGVSLAGLKGQTRLPMPSITDQAAPRQSL